MISSPAELKELAASLARLARTGDVFLLQGDLGAGKTEFARAFIQSLCGDETEVPSPTFTLLQVYESPRGLIHHYDLYRLESPDEVWELGLEEALSDAMTLIEWPERLPPLNFASAVTLSFSILSPEVREVHLTAGKAWQERMNEHV